MNAYSGPAEVKGFYQKIRDLLQPVLIILFVTAPWIQIRGEPMILFDIVNRHFVFFGSTFYSHEAPLLFFLAILLVLSIFLVTAVFGRLWCGWTCPHTVFLNAVFNRIERWILGPYTQRMIFYKSEDSFNKKVKIIFLHVVYMFICWMLSHSFVAYFVGAGTITSFIMDGPQLHMSTFVLCSVITLILYFNFAFFREKLCLYICPYGRFQSALIDRNSVVVSYDQIRGEPRAKMATYDADKGDCVDCRRCVNVCPAKIDIRNGFQLECISCGQCIDACDAVMTKMKRPEKLIRFETGNQKPITLKRFRLALYALLIVLFTFGLIWSLYQRHDIDISISRAHQSPFSSRFDGDQKILQNQIQLHLKNQTQKTLQIHLTVNEGFKLLSPAVDMKLEPNQDLKTTAFIEIQADQYSFDKNEVIMTLKSDNLELKRTLKFIRQD